MSTQELYTSVHLQGKAALRTILIQGVTFHTCRARLKQNLDQGVYLTRTD